MDLFKLWMDLNDILWVDSQPPKEYTIKFWWWSEYPIPIPNPEHELS